MKKRIVMVILALAICAGGLYLYMKSKHDKDALLSAEYVYANMFAEVTVMLNNINEAGYQNVEEARFKTNFVLGQIDMKDLKKSVEKCLLDNGISYDRTEDEDLINKCNKPFFEKIAKFALKTSLDEDKLIEAVAAHDLARLPQEAHNMLKDEGFSVGAVQMAPIIAYTRFDVYECVKAIAHCFNNDEDDGEKVSIIQCSRPCYSDYADYLLDVLEDYEYSIVR